MNDDLRLPELDDRLLDAVSAVVDDVADADERALVEGSADAQRWVAHLRGLRDEVAALVDVTPPVEARESAVAAALAAFDELQAPATVPLPAHEPEHEPQHRDGRRDVTAAPVISLQQRRQRWSRRLLAAAAAVVVIGGAGLAIRGSQHDDDMSESSATEVPTFDDPVAKAAPAEAPAATEAPAGAAAAGASPDAGSDTEAATEAADGATAMEALPSTIDAIPGAASVAPVISSADELAAFVGGAAQAYQTGVAATDAPAGSEAPAAAESAAESTAAPSTTASTADTQAPGGGAGTTCAAPGQVVIGSISYLGAPAIAVYDPATGSAIAYDAADCRLLASVAVS